METLGYNNYGYMATISADNAVRYTITGRNAREQLTAATYGNSLTASYGYDAYGYPSSTKTGTVQHYSYVFNPVTGNLTSRKNELCNLSESFAYDEDNKGLDRLTSVTGPQSMTLAMTYADNGNINTKSDIDAINAFSYGLNAGPYALTGVTSSTNIIPGVSQTITYNSFEKVTSISEANGSQTIYTSFTYNNDNQRAKMTVGVYYGSEILTRYYVGGSYMKEVQPNTTIVYTYLGGDAYTAPVVVHNDRGVVSYYYLLRDHLGNITHKVNTSNAVVAEYSFDAWGRRRNATNWTYTLDANDKALFADRGFTGHEYLPWYKLYNMNGRMYDPAVGRFLSADPVVKDPGNSQHYNRYSYCLNNPLKYTDLSGYTQAQMWTNEMTESMRAALGAWATALGYTVSNGIGSSSGDGFVGS
ncbi:MAG: RHS repeat-associated core domain-containing protein, partial [Candidatus Saccharibacteria bacterium]